MHTVPGRPAPPAPPVPSRWVHRVRALAKTAGTLLRPARPASVLLVPVPEAEPVIASWLGRDDTDIHGAPLHVTVIYPFLPPRSMRAGDLEAVSGLLRDIEPFSFALTRIDRFPGSVYYLAPEPAAPFIEMTARMTQRWPACQPYGGAFDSVVPHMTLPVGTDLPPDTGTLEPLLPITASVRELWLMTQTPSGWQTRQKFPLGGQ